VKRKVFLVGIITAVLVISAAMLLLNNGRKLKLLAILKEGPAGSGSLVAQAKKLESEGNLASAQAIYQKLVNDFPGSAEAMSWQKKAEDINIKLLFSPVVTPDSVLYEIKPGDTLNKIAKEFNTTVDLIKKSNNLSSDNIIPGKKIKVWTKPFSMLVDKSQNILMLKSGEEVFKTYIVSTGANNSTPIGTFKIVNKLENPTWYKAGAVVAPGSPQNILGSRWLGLSLSSYGIHGTTDPASLGKQVTQGCVRLSNSDVEELYIIVPLGSEVTIVD
jgi:lipoprotein-anchoring transpeptidase ErfK/SrfK